MLSKKMETALNKQLNLEMYSSYLYLSMAAYCAAQNLNGFSQWMRIQADEESLHAKKLFDYLLDRDGSVKLAAIAAPPAAWRSPLAVCQELLKHEQKNTAHIHQIVDLSLKEKDHATGTMLQWFVQEQVEEESTAKDLIEQVKLAAKSPGAMFMLDRELGQRPAASGPPA